MRSARSFRIAALFTAMHYLGLLAAVALLAGLLVRPEPQTLRLLLWAMAFSALSWLFALLKRRSARCPLCKGTPLVECGAITHTRARRIQPFNHGVSALLSIMTTRKFRCMYCGTDYDLRKRPRHEPREFANPP